MISFIGHLVSTHLDESVKRIKRETEEKNNIRKIAIFCTLFVQY